MELRRLGEWLCEKSKNLRLEAIATRVEAIATRVEAIATRVEAIATKTILLDSKQWFGPRSSQSQELPLDADDPSFGFAFRCLFILFVKRVAHLFVGSITNILRLQEDVRPLLDI